MKGPRTAEVEALIPAFEAKLGKGKLFDRVVPELLSQSVQLANGDSASGQKIASLSSEFAGLLSPRDYQVGMLTNPGDPVYGQNRDHIYLYTGKDKMTHSNPTFFPGASGVYYWSIVPDLYDGRPVFPDIPGIVVYVKGNSEWWDPAKSQLYRWNGEDYSCPSNFYPGAAGVHQWVSIT